MPYEYKRRRPSILKNFWVYRRLIGAAVVLGVMLWFVMVNHEQVTVHFPFGLGTLTSTSGVVMLLSALVGAVATVLVQMVVIAIRRVRRMHNPEPPPKSAEALADRPPADYAAKTREGFSNAHWSN
jgi:uncharacterized integral membrane protein